MYLVISKIYQDSTIVNSVLFENARRYQLFWTQENKYSFLVPPPGILFFQTLTVRTFRLIPNYKKNNYQHSMLCFRLGISTILPEFHSCFLVNIGLISKISEFVLDGSSSFFGAHISSKSIFRNSIFEVCNILLLLCFTCFCDK